MTHVRTVLLALVVSSPAMAFHMEDPLAGGSVQGHPVGGAFEAGGWRVTGTTDRMWFALPRLVRGSVEFTVSDLQKPMLGLVDNELAALYEAGYGASEPIPYAPNLRENHFKAMLRVYGNAETGREGSQKLIWAMCPSGAPGHGTCTCADHLEEPVGGNGDWDGSPQRVRLEWGDGHTRVYRNGVEALHVDWSAWDVAYGPEELHFSLGTPRPQATQDAQLPVGILFSNLVVDGDEGLAASCGGGNPVDAGVVVPPMGDDSAVLGQVSFPAAMACGETALAHVTLLNNGTSTWTTPAGYRLGAVAAQDPLHPESAAIALVDEAEHVDPGESYVFDIPLTAPGAAGAYTSSWRMLHDGVGPFGDTATATVTVTCQMASSSSTGASVTSSSGAVSGASSAVMPGGSSSLAPSSMGAAATSLVGGATSGAPSVSSSASAAVSTGGESSSAGGGNGQAVRCSCAHTPSSAGTAGSWVLVLLALLRRRAR